jgi:DNA-binding transcriptional LysR family regulator
MIVSVVEAQEIRVFLVLADELHFGRAAERLLLTPSRVSQIIRQLEARIGGRLFDRTSRRVRLGRLGEQLLRETQTPYRQLEYALEHAREAAAGVSGALRLGMYMPVNGGPHLVEIVKTFERRHPACTVETVETDFTRDQSGWLRSREVDLLATRLPMSDADVTIGPRLSSESRLLAVAAGHPLATRAYIDWDDVADYPVSDVAALPRELADALAPPVTSSGRPLRRVGMSSVGQILTRVALGEMVHPTVSSFAEYYRHPGVAFVPIRDLPTSDTAIVWLSADSSRNVAVFVETARAVLDTHAGHDPSR